MSGEYAAVGVKGNSTVVLGVEKLQLQPLEERSQSLGLDQLDDRIMMAYIGPPSEGKELVRIGQIICIEHKQMVEDPVAIGFLAEIVSQLTRQPAMKSMSCLVAGFNYDGSSHIYETKSNGFRTIPKVCAIGRKSKDLNSFLQTNFRDGDEDDEEAITRLAIGALMKVVLGARHMDVSVLRRDTPMQRLSRDELDQYVADIERQGDFVRGKRSSAPK